jgi:hypothetical protein
MKRVLLIAALALPCGAQAQEASDAASRQWFTGSLYAVSPALSHAGALAVEPYLITSLNTGSYDADGHHRRPDGGTDAAVLLTVVKYGLTDKLTIATTPSVTRSWNAVQGTGTGFGDLPIELEYRLRDTVIATGAPSITASIGLRLPTGRFDHLRNPLNGHGSGAWTLKAGLLAQSLFNTRGNHAMRVRLYGSVAMPLARVSVHDASVYGTADGFSGRVLPGPAAQIGMSVGYGLTQRWVLALDLLYDKAAGFALDGTRSDGTLVQARSPSSSSFVIAPAIEYSWSANAGIIAGVAFSAAGRNTASFVAPQIAVSLAF